MNDLSIEKFIIQNQSQLDSLQIDINIQLTIQWQVDINDNIMFAYQQPRFFYQGFNLT